MSRSLRQATYRARALRRASTPAERALWARLRGRRLGAKFRRQQPVGPFFVDFFCPQARLVIELDGAPHFPKPERDEVREAYLDALGLTVLRFPNHLVLRHPERVLDRIRAALHRASRAQLADWLGELLDTDGTDT